MRKIAIINQKGGVGKTTTAVNLSAALAATRQRVCLLDLDPQAHATLHFGVPIHEQPASIYDVLTGGADLVAARRQVDDNLWLVGSHIDLAAAEMELADVAGRESILRERLERDPQEFDFLLIDCPPSLGVLTINALTACDEVFIPLQPHFLALHGLSQLLETIAVIAERFNHNLRLGGVVLCLYEAGTRLASEVAHDVDEFLTRSKGDATPWSQAVTFQTRIRRNIRLAESPSFGQSILRYAPASHGASDYRQLAAEVLGQLASPPWNVATRSFELQGREGNEVKEELTTGD